MTLCTHNMFAAVIPGFAGYLFRKHAEGNKMSAAEVIFAEILIGYVS